MTLTRQDCIRQLPEGSDPLVIELHLAATAPERHASRVEAARAAVRDAFPTATDEQVGAILAMEAGGAGGGGGYVRDGIESTARMSWAARLGKGRRHAGDGAAWTAAIKAGATDPLSSTALLSAAELLCGSDLEWALAYALREAYAWRLSPPERAAEWAAAARSVAARCEPETDAGRLAARYGLATLPPLYLAEVALRAETIGEMLDVPESHLGTGDEDGYERSGVRILLVERCRVQVCSDVPRGMGEDSLYYDDGWRVRVSTRDPSTGAVAELVRRAWGWREGQAEHDALVALHEGLLGRWFPASQLAATREQWDAEERLREESPEAELASLPEADRRVAERVAALDELPVPEGAEERAVERWRTESKARR